MARFAISINGKSYEAELLSKTGTAVSFVVDGKRYDVDVAPLLPQPAGGQPALVHIPPPALQARSVKTDAVYSPMPGIVVQIAVKPGDMVEAGQTVLVIEAMKMENNVASPRAGKVKDVLTKAGQEVGNQQLLISFE